MQFGSFVFGSKVDSVTYDHDIVVDRGKVRKRKKKPSKKLRGDYGHTPLSVDEEIPWVCRRLVIGTGAYGSLPVMKEVKLEGGRRKIELFILFTAEAIKALEKDADRNECRPPRNLLRRAAKSLINPSLPVQLGKQKRNYRGVA
jgi:hypothetical protein